LGAASAPTIIHDSPDWYNSFLPSRRQAEPHHRDAKALRLALLEIVAMQRRAGLILDRS